jgi:hypothetical protein
MLLLKILRYITIGYILLMPIGAYSICGYCWLFYWRLLMVINNYFVGGYLKLNYHRILMIIGGYSIGRY